MSIHPVPTFDLVRHGSTDNAAARKDVSPSPRPVPARSESELKTGVEIPSFNNQPEFAEMPKDEVQVQRINGASGDIVIRYLDASGNLILQIPSSQVLGLARAVEKALEEQTSRKASAKESTLNRQGEAFDGH